MTHEQREERLLLLIAKELNQILISKGNWPRSMDEKEIDTIYTALENEVLGKNDVTVKYQEKPNENNSGTNS